MLNAKCLKNDYSYYYEDESSYELSVSFSFYC